jgi:hypothetical protein
VWRSALKGTGSNAAHVRRIVAFDGLHYGVDVFKHFGVRRIDIRTAAGLAHENATCGQQTY